MTITMSTRPVRARRFAAIAAGAAITALAGTGVGDTVAAFPPLEPVAVIAAAPLVGDAPLPVTFDGSGSVQAVSPIIEWSWNFGDGTTGTGSIVTHVYTAPGTYRATLVVSDGGLTSLPRAVTVEVSERGAPTAPTALTAVPRGSSSTSTVLIWTNTDTDQAFVRIERCRGPRCTNFRKVATVRGDVNAFIDTGLAAGTVYRYRVYAVNELGRSPFSNTATTKTLATR